MKTTIRKLENMGLNEEQIRKVFEWDEPTFVKRKRYPFNQFDVEDLPQKIDAVVKGYDLKELKKVKLFDEIYEINGLPKSNEDNAYKIEMISEFPKLLNHIKISRIHSEIDAIKTEEEKLLAQLEELRSQKTIKQNEIDMLNTAVKVETKPIETETPVAEESSDKTITESDFYIDYTGKKGLIIRVGNRTLFDEVAGQETINLAYKGKIEKHKIKTVDTKNKRFVTVFVGEILVNKSYVA